jgi:hypothetical protein
VITVPFKKKNMKNLYLFISLFLSSFTLFAQVTPPSGHSNKACGSSSISLYATGADASEIYKWYDAPTSGKLLFSDPATTNSDTSFYNTGILYRSDTFYVCIDSSGILSSFTAVIATINPLAADVGQSYLLNTLNNGLFAYYPFNGNAYDESANGHNGIIYNAGFKTGINGSAINFTGDQSSYINAGNWNFPDSFSISVFFNLKDTSTGYLSRMIIAKYDDPNIDFFVDIKDQATYYSARLGFKSKNSSQTYYISDSTKLYAKKWYNLIITYNGKNLVQMYINGKLKWEKSNIATQGVFSSAVPVTIGKAYNNPFASNDADFAGSLDDLRIYRRVLNQQEIYEINNPGRIGIKLHTDTICKGQSDTITIFRSEPGINYQLYNNSTSYGTAQNGNGSTLKFTMNNIMSSAMILIHATNINTGCSRILDTLLHIQANCCLADISENIKITPPANGLVAYYPFTGNAFDESLKGNNGIINGATLAADKSGKANNAYSFDGNDYISVNNNASLNFDSSDFSISLWIYPKVIKNLYIFGKDNYNGSQPSPFGSGYYLQYSVAKSQDIRFATRSISSNTSNFLPSVQIAPINTWTHVVGVRKKNVLKLYINGKLDNAMIETVPTNTNNSVNLKFGRADEISTNYFNGILDDALIYNRALTDQEIIALYNDQPKLQVKIEEKSICSKDSTNFMIINPQPGIAYSVHKATDSSIIGKAQYRYSDTLRLSSGKILNPGSFLIYANDTATGCSSYLDTILSVYSCVKLKVSSTSSNCGQHNGSAEVQINGGTPPYRIMWSSGDTLLTADSLYSGIYTVQVWDSKGDNTIASVNVNDISGPQIQIDKIVSISCNGKSNGAIQTTITNGSTPYTLEWSNGKTTDDINNLESGPYEITVSDTNKCSTTKTIIVTEPEPLSVKIITTEATCKAADGSATAFVSGGTKPYSYLWSNGDNDSFANDLKAGFFAVSITDFKGCKAVLPANVAVNNTGGPVIRFDSMHYADIDVSNGALYITYSGGTKPYDTIRWSNGTGKEDITAAAGIYDLKIIDHKGCKGSFSGQIYNKPVITPEICIVTVDSATGRNLVVWKKPKITTISYYNIYRETSIADKYMRVDSILYDSLSLFLDPVAKPVVRSWRYKISAVDKTGRETELSPEHKTIHLTVNVGLGNTFNLIWDHYNGFPVTSYYIYRYLKSEGWVAIDSIASTLTSYTDAPDTLFGLKYFIAIKKADGPCMTTRAQNSGGPYSQSSSNMKDYSTIYVQTGIQSIVLNQDVKVFPNPTNNIVNIITLRKDIEKLMVYDVLGNKIIETRFSSLLDMSTLAKGFYIIKLTGANDRILAIERVVKN